MRFHVGLLAAFAIVLGGGDSAAQVVIAGQEDDSVPETQCTNPTQAPCVNDEPCYGQSVGISGSLAIVGAPDQLNDDNNETGLAYVHSRKSAQLLDRWTVEGNEYDVILAPNVQGMARFGFSVAIQDVQGTLPAIALVGAPGQGTSGFAYVFERSGSTWGAPVTFAPTGTSMAEFGSAVAIDGETAVSGARMGHLSGADDESGFVLLLIRVSDDWSAHNFLNHQNPEEGDNLGASVDISGDTLVAGAPGRDVISTPQDADVGSVVVFRRNGSGVTDNWSQEAEIVCPNQDGGELFGYACAISGNTIAVGAPFLDITSSSNAGLVYVFTRSGTVWSLQDTVGDTSPAPTSGRRFGESLDLDGDILVVGNTGVDRRVWVFHRSGSSWNLQDPDIRPEMASESNPPGGTDPDFGYDVAISGTLVCVGAPQFDDGASTEPQGRAFYFGSMQDTIRTYCQAKDSTATFHCTSPPCQQCPSGLPSGDGDCCLPQITYSGLPRAVPSVGDFEIIGHNVVVYDSGGTGQSSGALMYGVAGRANTSFHNGKLCVKTAVNIRGIVVNGGEIESCDNTFVMDLTDLFTHMGQQQVPHFIGRRINAQYLYDDPAANDQFNDALTQGLEFVIIP